MPNWLRELQAQQLSAEELSSVASKVAAAGEAHSKQTARIEPTEKELNQRYNR